MRAKLVYERFKAESDPVSDMNIGVKSMSLEEIAKLTADKFKPFGITVFYRTYDNRPGEVQFDLFDNVLQKELSISDFSFIHEEVGGTVISSEGGWFIDGVDMEYPTYDINKIIKIVLNIIYGDKRQTQMRIKYLKEVVKYYEENS